MNEKLVIGTKFNGISKVSKSKYVFRFRKKAESRGGKFYTETKTVNNSGGVAVVKSIYNKWKKGVEERFEQEQLDFENNELVSDSNILFSELANLWFENQVVAKDIAMSTLSSQKEILDRIVKSYPEFGKKKVKLITGIDCNNVKQKIVSRKIRGRNVSTDTVYKYIVAIEKVFEFAKNGLKIIKLNPMANLNVRPKYNLNKTNILSEEELKIVLRELHKLPDHLQLFFNISILTGMRRGEVCGLEYHNINFEEKNIIVKQSLSNDKIYNEGYEFKSTKNGLSRRVPLFYDLEYLLNDYEVNHGFPSWIDKGGVVRRLIVAYPDGSPYKIQYYSKEWAKFCKVLVKEKKISKEPTLRDLRKAYLTLLMREKKVSPNLVKEIAGHQKVQTTLDYYIDDDNSKEIAELSNTYIFS